MFNDRDLTRRYYSSYSLLFACFGHFDFSPICTGRVYGARRSTSLLSANESRLQRIREVYARSKKKICEGGRRDAMVVGNVGLQQRWELTLTRISLRQVRAFASSVSSNPRPMHNYTYTRVHCRRVICTKVEARESV